jgi:antitoxin component of MazEF toxin-antitoxin module
MSKVTKTNECGAPKLKQLQAEFNQQVSVQVDSASIVALIMKASLPELAKQVAKGNSYHSSVNGAIKALNTATALDLKVTEINDAWDGYHGFNTVLSDAGMLRQWRTQRPGCDFTESVDTADLYEGTVAEVHITFSKKLKDKKFLASKGVK